MTTYRTADGRVATYEDLIQAHEEHRHGPAQVRVLCRCGREFWGDTEAEATELWWHHNNDAVGYPLTAVELSPYAAQADLGDGMGRGET